MVGVKHLVFPPFNLDTVNECILNDGKKIPLRPKSLAVLRYLVEHPQRLVLKGELLGSVWKDTQVGDATLKVSIREIRHALGDDVRAPKYIESVGRRGYRFIGSIATQLRPGPQSSLAAPVYLVGREEELEHLKTHLDLARSGKRQVIFITGEPGIGKTTLVEAFVASLTSDTEVATTYGQCIEQFGAGEAYLPVLDALERLCRISNRGDALSLLRCYAPSWLLNLPALINPDERSELERQNIGVTTERKLREGATLLEALAQEQTIILILGNLHWADPSTLALISFLAGRMEYARLLLVGTYRDADFECSNHPLKTIRTELQLHGHCSHLALSLLSQSEVGQYLAARFQSHTVPKALQSTIYWRSEGNPLFMVNVTDYLVSHGTIVRQNDSIKFLETIKVESVPENIRALIERQVGTLPREDQELLEAASVAGMIFSVAVLARALKKPREQIEDDYQRLAARTHFLQYAGSRKRPDGRGSPRYSFVHALYQNVIYDRIGHSKRGRLHQIIGERTEAAYAGVTETVAAELAHHFEHAGDYQRAIRYLLEAARTARLKSAYQEAVGYAKLGLKLIKTLPACSERSETEFALEVVLGSSVSSIKGYSANETNEAFSRAKTLSSKVENKSLIFQALAGLWSFYLLHGQLRASLEEAQEMLKLAKQAHDPIFLVNAYMTLGMSHFHLGDIVAARHDLEQSISYYHPARDHRQIDGFGWDPAVCGSCYRAKSTWMLGYPEQDLKIADTTLALARELANPFHVAHASASLANHFASRRDVERAGQLADAAISVSTENGFTHWLALGTMVRGWALCKRGDASDGLACFQEGLEKWRSMGAQSFIPAFLSFQAECYEATGQYTKALASIEEGLALSDKNHDFFYYPELFRLKGELVLKRRRATEIASAESLILKAIDISRRQKVKSYELRAMMSFYSLRRKTANTKAARAMLQRVYGWFAEGFDSPDLCEARRLLEELK